MITVTENATAQVDRLMADEQITRDAFIRVGVQGGGCSGLSYQLNFDNEVKPEDKIF